MVLGLVALSACGDPVSTSETAFTPMISVAGGAGGAVASSAKGGSGSGGAGSSGSSGSSAAATGGSGGAAASSSTGGQAGLPAEPPLSTNPPNFTAEQFCALIRVDEGGSLVIAGCEENIRTIYSLEREQTDGGAWRSVAYGIEAPCSDQGTYRAEVSGATYGTSGAVASYAFVIRAQAGYEVSGALSTVFDAARLTVASGSVQGNACQFTICPASECGVLDTSQISTVRGDNSAGASSTPTGGASPGNGGNGGRSFSSGGTASTAGRGSTGGRTGTAGTSGASAGSGGRATGGSGSGLPPFG